MGAQLLDSAQVLVAGGKATVALIEPRVMAEGGDGDRLGTVSSPMVLVKAPCSL